MRPKRDKRVAAGEFKTHCLRLMDEVRNKQQEIVITKHGKAIAKLVPYSEDDEPTTLFGCLKGTVVIHGDIIGGTGEDWDADA